MDPVLEKVILTIVGIATTSLIGWLTAQIVKYKKLIKKEEDETVKKTITDSLTPLKTSMDSLSISVSGIQTDVSNMKNDISKLQTSEVNFTTRLQPMQDEIDHLKDDITEILNDLKQKGIDLSNIREQEEVLAHETRCAWRYRIRQLCHVYIARGYMSFDEYSQLQEMYNIYTAIGGNGQTRELYEKTMDTVEIKTDAEIVALRTLNTIDNK